MTSRFIEGGCIFKKDCERDGRKLSDFCKTGKLYENCGTYENRIKSKRDKGQGYPYATRINENIVLR
jgi:hypothetical protein